jgi:hypothetical protein
MANRWVFESVEALDRFTKKYFPKGKRVGESKKTKKRKVGESGARKVAVAEAGLVFNPSAAAMQRVADAKPASPKELRKMADSEFREHAGRILMDTVTAGGHGIAEAYWQATTRGEKLATPLDAYIAGLNGEKAA